MSNLSSGMSRPQLGFTMIEVLVAMLLLLVGVLGVVASQVKSFQNSREAFYRNQATLIAEDLVDRVRGNPTGLIAGYYDNINFPASPVTGSAPCTAACPPEEVALRDKLEWSRYFVESRTDAIASIPAAKGIASRDALDPDNACGNRIKYDVTVTWLDGSDAGSGSVTVSACLDA